MVAQRSSSSASSAFLEAHVIASELELAAANIEREEGAQPWALKLPRRLRESKKAGKNKSGKAVMLPLQETNSFASRIATVFSRLVPIFAPLAAALMLIPGFLTDMTFDIERVLRN